MIIPITNHQEMIGKDFSKDFSHHFNNVFQLLEKIEKWWFANFILPIEPSLEGRDIDPTQVIPEVTNTTTNKTMSNIPNSFSFSTKWKNLGWVIK